MRRKFSFCFSFENSSKLSSKIWIKLWVPMFLSKKKNRFDELDELKCRNHEILPVETVRVHIHRFGFNTMYTKWIHCNPKNRPP